MATIDQLASALDREISRLLNARDNLRHLEQVETIMLPDQMRQAKQKVKDDVDGAISGIRNIDIMAPKVTDGE